MHYLDIHGQPRANLLAELIQYCAGESKATLEKLCGSGGHDPVQSKKFYQSWVLDGRRTIYHILEDLPELTVPIDHLMELLPRLQPRYYSIASSPKIDPTKVAICAIVVKYETSSGRTNNGVATGYLKAKIPSGNPESVPSPRIPVFIRRSQFKLPFRPSTPVIMIGPGTGFAPFRGFLQHRQWQKQDGRDVGDTILFTGCRNRDVDYIYKEELDEFVNNGTLTQLHCAFSRDQENKVYVQHLLEQQKQTVFDVLKRNGHIYVCG